MNILLLTLLDFNSIDEDGIYTDLMREFVRNNHQVYIVSPSERKNKQKTYLIKEKNCEILKLQIGNIQKTNLLEKGISMLTIEPKFKTGISKYFGQVKFDLVIYSTPPITLQKAVEYVKKRDQAKTYLLLKDIFPQNALDLGMMSDKGIKSIIYKYFRSKEQKLYKISDYIGCMSPANVNYLLEYNSSISPNRVEVCPNSIEPKDIIISKSDKEAIRAKYGIPLDKVVFIYGGNLGKPQGIDFIIDCISTNRNHDVFFLLVGSGTEYSKLDNFIKKSQLNSVKLLSALPRDDYEALANSADVGLVFLDHRFTIPNFPSRILSYMQVSIPILAATDVNTDLGQILDSGEFGLWCESTDVGIFHEKVKLLCDKEIRDKMGENARNYLENNYTARASYDIIISKFK